MTIGEAIRHRREELGVKQVWLAAKAGISRQALANIELRGAIPGADTLENIAKHLGLTPNDLMLGRAS